MREFLLQSGEVHLQAAYEHLSNTQIGDPHPEDEVMAAIEALGQAYHFCIKAVPMGFKRAIKELEPIMASSIYMKDMECYEKACTIAVLQSACYAFLRKPHLVQKYTARATDCFRQYAIAKKAFLMPLPVSADFTPKIYPTMSYPQRLAQLAKLIEDDEKKFQRTLQSLDQYLILPATVECNNTTPRL